MYTPDGPIVPYKAAICLLAAAEARRCRWTLTDGPIGMSIEWVFARPPSHLTARGELRQTAPTFPGLRCGDVDNLEKGVLDAITRCGVVWQDDTQVVKVDKEKRFCGPGEAARTTVVITRL